MGAVLSTVRGRLRKLVLSTILGALRLVPPSLDAPVIRYGTQSPGLPVPNPTPSYWMAPPAPISRHNASAAQVPEYADIVIIGSGITGTSIARTILDRSSAHSGNPPRIVMVEARETCSGATGRNGGHITPVLYGEYADLKKEYGEEMAKRIIRFRLSHLPEFLAVAEEEGLMEDSQCREVDAFDVYQDPTLFRTAKSLLAVYRTDLPTESKYYKTYEGAECIKNLQLSPRTVGCCSTRAGSVHPYRLVTGILSRLLKVYPTSFDLYTQTPCIAISPPKPHDLIPLYQVMTSKGIVRTPHIVHATNGWVSHLLPGMHDKIIPARGIMTSQKPPTNLGNSPIDPRTADSYVTEKPTSWASTRSFVFFPTEDPTIFDYLTQQRAKGPSKSEAELMFGGGLVYDADGMGNADDSKISPETTKYLSTVLDDFFDAEENRKGKERVKAAWSGIMGFSVDARPWVGRIPEVISGRRPPKPATISMVEKGVTAGRLAPPGEWMAAGYSGEGMVHAWMSGKALAYMVLGQGEVAEKSELNGFPEVFKVTEQRWRDAEAVARLEEYFAYY